MKVFTESIVEDAALEWLQGLSYTIQNGPLLAVGEIFAERYSNGCLSCARTVGAKNISPLPILKDSKGTPFHSPAKTIGSLNPELSPECISVNKSRVQEPRNGVRK